MVVHFPSRSFSDKLISRRRQIYQGSKKILFEGPESGTYVLYFTDDLPQGQTDPLTITGKGVINNRLSEIFMSRLTEIGIAHHFIKCLNMREQQIKSAEILPVNITVYNSVTASLAQRFSLEEGTVLQRPLFEFSLKNSKQHHVLSREHIYTFNLIPDHECDEMIAMAGRISDFIFGQLLPLELRLASIKLEFGRVFLSDIIDHSELIVIDEISLDTCEIVDITKDKILKDQTTDGDKTQKIAKIYQDIAERFGILHHNVLKVAE